MLADAATDSRDSSQLLVSCTSFRAVVQGTSRKIRLHSLAPLSSAPTKTVWRVESSCETVLMKPTNENVAHPFFTSSNQNWKAFRGDEESVLPKEFTVLLLSIITTTLNNLFYWINSTELGLLGTRLGE